MASSKLSELAVATGATSSDLLYIVQAGTGKRISFTSLTNSIKGLLGTTSVLVNAGHTVELNSTGALVLSVHAVVLSPTTGITLSAEVENIVATTTTAGVGTTSVAFVTASAPRLTYMQNTLAESSWYAVGPGVIGEAGVVEVTTDGAYTIVTLNQPTIADFAQYTFSTAPHEWVFGEEGKLTMPHGMTIDDFNNRIRAAANASVQLVSHNLQEYIIVDDNTITIGANGSEWFFEQGGSQIWPDSSAMVPATSTSMGTKGTVVWDSNHVYFCVATNTWKRASLNSW